MTMPGRPLLGAVLMAALIPSSLAAQPVARTFADLQAILKPGDYVIVADRADRETWGQVKQMSDRALTVVRVIKRAGRLETDGEGTAFGEDSVSLILRSDASGARGAGVYPASWAHLGSVPDGEELTVTLASGERRQVRSAGVSADGLRALTASGGQEMFARSDVVRVERHGVNDPVGNGIAIGALAGAGAGFGLIAASYAACTGGCEAPAPGPMYGIAMSMGAGVGALVGWIADRTHKGKQVVFPTVAPVVTRERKGLSLTVRF